jgi:hypothetical protein
MRRQEIVYFAVALFFALVALIKWKRRRDAAIERVNRGLRGYVAAKVPAAPEGADRKKGEDLIPIP